MSEIILRDQNGTDVAFMQTGNIDIDSSIEFLSSIDSAEWTVRQARWMLAAIKLADDFKYEECARVMEAIETDTRITLSLVVDDRIMIGEGA